MLVRPRNVIDWIPRMVDADRNNPERDLGLAGRALSYGLLKPAMRGLAEPPAAALLD